MAETILVQRVGLTIELLLHKKYGVRGRELVAQALDLNRGITAAGLELPMGTSVTLPDLPPAMASTVAVKSLFG